MTKYYAHRLKINAQKNERSHAYIIFMTYNIIIPDIEQKRLCSMLNPHTMG